MTDTYKTLRDVSEERFINAEDNYERFVLLRDLISCIEELEDTNKRKDAEIARLCKQIKGYALSDYELYKHI